VLGQPQVSIRDNFFDLGGNSVTMVSVHRRLVQVLERELAVVELFQFSTVEALANHLERGAPERDGEAVRQERAARRHQSADQRRAARQQRSKPTHPSDGEP
jgi:Phosphopantetheine attachment site